MAFMASEIHAHSVGGATLSGERRGPRPRRPARPSRWVGCVLWDLIQPAFMFMVGVALPFSIASRRGEGQSFGRMLLHASCAR